MSDRILVTGAAGLLGSTLVNALAARGFDVVGTWRPNGFGSTIDSLVACDLAEPSAVIKLLSDLKPGAIIHAAGRIRSESNSLGPFVRDNVLATANILDGVQLKNIRKFVFISSISVYSGDGPFTEDSATEPNDPYGWSKRKAEELCGRLAGALPTILRLGGLHGNQRNGGVIHEFIIRAIRGQPIMVAEPETEITLTFLGDVVAAVDQILRLPFCPRGEVFNVASDEAVSLGQLADIVVRLAESKSTIHHVYSNVKRNRILSTDKIRKDIGFQSIPLIQRLSEMIAFARS